MKVPAGFRFAGVHAGIKSNRKDLALIFSEVPCAAAGCFTANRAKAAPVLDAERRLPAQNIQAVLVNSGNANALTGPAGLEDVAALAQGLGKALNLPAGAIVSASTGVIGHRLPLAKLLAALPTLVGELGPLPEPAAEAIMTTDTRPKMAARQIKLGGKAVTLSAICKGSGMIHPELATMIAVVVTDCAIAPEALALALRGAMPASFNSLTVDGDMSTNDTVYALANGKAGNPLIQGPGSAFDTLSAAITDLCQELAKEIAADGEGATKLLEIQVTGAPTQKIAQDLARSVALSSLVKAAMFGADPNWGRILSAVGARAGSQAYEVNPYTAQVAIQGIVVYDGGPNAHDPAALKSKMRAPEVKVEVDLKGGSGQAVAWGCDLSYDYVKINADYSSLIVPMPDGAMAKDNRLSNYSPAFKTSLLVEALSYISRFSGKRCVIGYGGAGMVKESLKKFFCSDVNLLRSVGLKPVVVHGGGPEIKRTLEKLGSKGEVVDGVSITDASNIKVVEMVLTGAINTELVTLLNRNGTHAVGVSGKDGALLRARQLAQGGQDLGQMGEILRVNRDFLEMLLTQAYVPVISPIGIGEDGQSYNLNADAVAAAVASAISADKLIYLSDVPGILRGGDLLTELSAPELQSQLSDGTISGGMKVKAQSILDALRGGVEQVHVVDGRVPHSLIGELFTDRGVGTLVTR